MTDAIGDRGNNGGSGSGNGDGGGDERRRLQALRGLLGGIGPRVVACSGGIDSLLLATVAHRQDPAATVVAHAVSPAVPADATARVEDRAAREGWSLTLVRSGEFQNEAYLGNPANRCYHCKTSLYDALGQLETAVTAGATLLSGANLDDLGEYRPGLIAAAERGVRHPFVEAGIGKSAIRAIARHLGLPFAALPASPCLASRLYTGTRVTAGRLAAIEAGEALIRRRTGIGVVRCRVREQDMIVEIDDADRDRLSEELLDAVFAAARRHEPGIAGVRLDPKPYRPGRAFLVPPA